MALMFGLPAAGRRRQTTLIIISAIIPLMFILSWLLTWSSPSMPQMHSEIGHDHHDDMPDHETSPPEMHEPPPAIDQGDHTADLGPNAVKASTGHYAGKIDQDYSNVREFLRIPYAQSPVDKNRFMPPVPVAKSDMYFDSTEFGKVCPQFISDRPSIWSEQIPWYRIPHSVTGETADLSGEDCLSLAIWTPSNATADSMLPVAMFWPGGGFQTNGILVPAHQPAQWVSRSQAHIVVTINYRLGIFGFPNAEGVKQQNLGLLDQRAALEWVYDNIAHFGGDPSRILVWGFSAGAQSVDFHNYAYWEDPIAHAYFAQSGSSLAFGSGTPVDHAKFTMVARKFGCEFSNAPAAELDCMQKIDFKELTDFLGSYHGDYRLRFGPTPDEHIVFSDYRERARSGKMAQVPMIFSSCSNDGAALAPYNAQNPQIGPEQATVDSITKRIACGTIEASTLRHDAGLPSYVYQYDGNWPNQDPLPWMGAYHSSDLVMFFGTHDNNSGPASTPAEIETSEAMQDFLLSYMNDPYYVERWETFDPTAEEGGRLLLFGANGTAVQTISSKGMGSACFTEGLYG